MGFILLPWRDSGEKSHFWVDVVAWFTTQQFIDENTFFYQTNLFHDILTDHLGRLSYLEITQGRAAIVAEWASEHLKRLLQSPSPSISFHKRQKEHAAYSVSLLLLSQQDHSEGKLGVRSRNETGQNII